MAGTKTKLKRMRELRGLSQSQVAQISGVPVRALQFYEQGRLNFNHSRIDKIFSIALALDCDVEDILDDDRIISVIRRYQNA